jgi:hypothetical protein
MKLAWALPFLLCAPDGHAAESLCTGDEAVVFSCHLPDKTISLCRPSAQPRDLRFRLGKLGSLELVYPGSGADGSFYRTTVPLYGGGTTSVLFSREGEEYGVYAKMERADSGASPADREPISEDGMVILRKGEAPRQVPCDDGGEGFREDLSWLPERP